jgi:mono/diheme cytochrome c family protein
MPTTRLTLLVILLPATTWIRAQDPEPGVSPILTPSLVGEDLYEAYCATCHGRDDRGDGPVAEALRARPSDLTSLAQQN